MPGSARMHQDGSSSAGRPNIVVAKRRRHNDNDVGQVEAADGEMVSKYLSSVLRHEAQTLGLFVRADGLIKLVDILALPTFRAWGTTESDI